MGCRKLDIRSQFYFTGAEKKPHSREETADHTQKTAYSRFSHTVISNYRYYSPQLGRWLSRDPVAEQGGLNLYAMVANNPVGRWDLIGLKTVKIGEFYSDYKTEKSFKYLDYEFQVPVKRTTTYSNCECIVTMTYKARAIYEKVVKNTAMLNYLMITYSSKTTVNDIFNLVLSQIPYISDIVSIHSALKPHKLPPGSRGYIKKVGRITLSRKKTKIERVDAVWDVEISRTKTCPSNCNTGVVYLDKKTQMGPWFTPPEISESYNDY